MNISFVKRINNCGKYIFVNFFSREVFQSYGISTFTSWFHQQDCILSANLEQMFVTTIKKLDYIVE